jgi:hypothetical protein
MALWFPLMVNDTEVGHFYAQRREAQIPADRVCTYDVRVVNASGKHQAVVRHNYDHGAFTLVRAAIAAIAAEVDE